MTITSFLCRFCQGERPHDGKFCLGCGSPVENARISPTGQRNRPSQKRAQCPKCGSGGNQVLGDGSLVCRNCGAWFDPDNEGVVAVDTRPEQNAMKKEERSRK